MSKKKSNSNSLSVFGDKYLTKLLSDSGNAYASLVEDNDEKFQYFDTGSYTLNLLLSGSVWKGHPDNFITVFAGESATGKSFFIIAMLKEFQKQYPNGMAFVFESENAPTWMKDSLKKAGVDTSRLVKYPVTTVQEVTHQATKLATMYSEIPEDERPPSILILDSLGNLSTDKEMSDSEEGKPVKDMTRPPEIKKMFRVLTQKLGKVNMPMFVTNHVYDVIGCGSEEMQVISNDKPVSIKDVKIGDLVNTLYGKDIVTQKFEYNVTDTYELELSDGTIFNVTPNHKFMNQEGLWKTIEELNEGDFIISTRI